MNEEFELSIAGKRRTLTRFICSELLYDFVEDKLDAGRASAVKAFLHSNREAQKELESLKQGLGYVDKLSSVEISANLIARVRDEKTGWESLASQLSWRQWPDTARWGFQAVLISVSLALIVSLLPMHKLVKFWPRPAKEVILAEIAGSKSPKRGIETIDLDDESETPTPPRELPTPAPMEPIAKGVPSVDLDLQFAPFPLPTPLKLSTPDLPIAAKLRPNPHGGALAEGPPAAREESEEKIGVKKGRSSAGFVYRAFMATSTIEEVTPVVRELVEGLGGVKAGEVELGWRKATGSYFHFSLPESNYENLLSSLRNFGPVRIYKDPHGRVMPENEIRLILFIEDLNLKK